jgi:hypothetical protein
MAHSASRRGVSGLAIPLMLLSFILLGGFLYWLRVTAEPTQPPMIEEGEVDTSSAGATDVAPTALNAATGQYVGQRVRLAGVEVASPVGAHAFFVNLTPQVPFLVKMDSSLVARGMAQPTGRVTVVGAVHAMTDSIIDLWTREGAVTAGDRPVVEFATYFIEAESITPAAGGG